jgi:hypothetical protein
MMTAMKCNSQNPNREDTVKDKESFQSTQYRTAQFSFEALSNNKPKGEFWRIEKKSRKKQLRTRRPRLATKKTGGF